MKTLQIQKEFMTKIEKHQKAICDISEKAICDISETEVWKHVAIGDGFRIYLINVEDFYLDSTKMSNHKFCEIIRDTEKEEGYENAWLTNEMRVFQKDKLNRIENAETHAYVNEKFLKYFEDATFKIKHPCRPVLVYENEVLRGLVLPVKIEEEE